MSGRSKEARQEAKETAKKYKTYCKERLYKHKQDQPKFTLSLVNKINRREFYKRYKVAKKKDPNLKYADYVVQVKAADEAELEASLAKK